MNVLSSSLNTIYDNRQKITAKNPPFVMRDIQSKDNGANLKHIHVVAPMNTKGKKERQKTFIELICMILGQ